MASAAAVLAAYSVARAEEAGKAVNVSGTVLVRNEKVARNGSGMRILKPGLPLVPGDVINTSSSGTAKILMKDKSIVDLGGSTLFKIDEFKMQNEKDRTVALSLPYGKMRASVNVPVGPRGKFTVRSRSATMGVRGTEFLVASDLDFMPEAAPTPAAGGGDKPAAAQDASREGPKETPKTQITVLKGKVEVADRKTPAAAPVSLTSGTQLTTTDAPAGDSRGPAQSAPKIVKLDAEAIQSLRAEVKADDSVLAQAIVIGGEGGSAQSLGGGEHALAGLTDDLKNVQGDLDRDGPPEIQLPMNTGIRPTLPTIYPGMPANVTVIFRK